MKEKTKKNNQNSQQQQQFEFCEVCKLNHNQGRRHNYLPKHKSTLSTLLTRFQSKINDVKFFLKTPMLLRPEHARQNRLWCVFCSCDVVEIDSAYACGKAIEHLASVEHWKRVKAFMWKYGGAMDRVDLFRITEVDCAKWEKKCKSLNTESAKPGSIGPVAGPSNNIHNEMNADYVHSNKNNVNSLNFNNTNDVVPLHSYTDERTPVSCSGLSFASEAGPSFHNMPGNIQVGDAKCNPTGYTNNQHSSNTHHYPSVESVHWGAGVANGESRPQGLQDLTQISSKSQEVVEGNIHTGAPPPWFDAMKGSQLELSSLISSKAGKSSKLNPKRVGAAWAERRKLEMELERRGEIVDNNFDANWLPNFGGVWQSGTRKESKKQFRMENKPPVEADNQSEKFMPLQPYISKRMRRDTSE